MKHNSCIIQKPFRFLSLICILVAHSFSIPSAHSQSYLELASLSPHTDYKTFETEHFQFIYETGYEAFTQKAAHHYEHVHQLLSPILKWTPRTKVTVLIADNADSTNGFSLPAFRVGMVLIATPPDAWSTLAYSDDWIKLLVFHEYTHYLNIDATTGWMEALRIVFGDAVRPNGLWPIWMIEGLAVYFETRMTSLGRGRSPYWDSVLRAYIHETKLGTAKDYGLTLDRVNGDFPIFPGGDIPYLFGYHLWNQFSKDAETLEAAESKMGDYSYHSSHRVPYFIEGNLENITGKNWIDYWNSFVQETETRLGPQIKAIQDQNPTTYETLTQARYGALGGAISPDGKWMAFTQTTLERRQGLYLKDLQSSEDHHIDDKLLGVGMAFTPDSRYLIYSSMTQHQTFQSFSDLYAYDLQEKSIHKLTEGLRAKEPSLSLSGDSVVFLQVSKGTFHLASAELVRSDDQIELKHIKTLYEPKPFTILGNPRFLSNDVILFSEQETEKAYSDLVSYDLKTQKKQTYYHDGQMNRFPVPTENGVLFVSDDHGVQNIYRLEGSDLKSSRKKPVTQVITGTTLPFTGPNGELYASLMTSMGYEIVKYDLSSATVNTPSMVPSAPVALGEALGAPPSLTLPESEDYCPWSTLAPRQWSPFFSAGTQTGTSAGGFLLGFDSTGKHQYSALGSYNFKPKTVDGQISYTYYGMRPAITLSARAETNNIGTGVGGTRYTREQELFLGLDYPTFWTFSYLRASLYGFIGWNGAYDSVTRFRYTTNNFEFDQESVPGLGASIIFSDTETSKLGFTQERGTRLRLATESKFNVGEFAVWKYLIDFSHRFKIGEHSVLDPRARWLGTSMHTPSTLGYTLLEGKNTGDLFDEGTNTSLTRLGIRGYSDITLIPTTSHGAGVISTDYHFPIAPVFRGLDDTFPAFLEQIHGFVFAETGYIPVTRYGALLLPSYGMGLTFDTTLLVRAPVSISLQMQKGTRSAFGADQLFFLSLSSNPLF